MLLAAGLNYPLIDGSLPVYICLRDYIMMNNFLHPSTIITFQWKLSEMDLFHNRQIR